MWNLSLCSHWNIIVGAAVYQNATCNLSITNRVSTLFLALCWTRNIIFLLSFENTEEWNTACCIKAPVLQYSFIKLYIKLFCISFCRFCSASLFKAWHLLEAAVLLAWMEEIVAELQEQLSKTGVFELLFSGEQFLLVELY